MVQGISSVAGGAGGRQPSCVLSSLQAAPGGLKRRRKPGDTPDPGREDPAPLWAFVPCQFVNNHAAASKKKEKRFFGDTPNPGKGPRPLQSRLRRTVKKSKRSRTDEMKNQGWLISWYRWR